VFFTILAPLSQLFVVGEGIFTVKLLVVVELLLVEKAPLRINPK
jgi:hypothetical protein